MKIIKGIKPRRNNYLFQIIGLSIWTLIFLSCTNQNDTGKLEVGKKGNITTIVIPDDSDQVIQFAASELQSYLKKMTGVALQIKKLSETNDKIKSIHLIHKKNNEINWDGYSIVINQQAIVLSAVESRGLLFAVYALLEDVGCSFFYLGKNEEIVPQKDKIVFQQSSEIFNPQLEHRGIAPYGLQESSLELGRDFIDWMAKNKFNYILVSEDRPSDVVGSAHGSIWKEVDKELLPELQKRGFICEMSEHCTHIFFPHTLFEKHPDWYALNDGKRKLGQMCYANIDAVEYYSSAVADYAAVHPEFKVIGTWPLDGGGYCECEGCKNPQTIFNAAKRVAEKVKKVRPDMIVQHLAYKLQTWQPPVEDIPDNMSILWCPNNGEMDDLASEWIRKASNAGGVYQFEYYMGDNYRSRANVWLRPEFSANIARHAQDIGFKGIVSLFLPMENWWRSCFNNWFFSKACWDQNFDINEGLHEYTQKYYGEQANEVKNIFQTIFSELHPEPYLRPTNQEYIDKSSAVVLIAKKILDQIDSSIENNKDSDINIRLLRLKTYVEFFYIYKEAFTNKKKEDLDRLMEYSKTHPEQDMILMYPEYIKDRNGAVLSE
ncbi:MAG: DUF4838 domain-containing protein [Flavobacteriaceae bacterium]|nr:DUF4838 domain-containing protein [Flavobacteriaceae bacterium]